MCQGNSFKQLDYKEVYDAPPGCYWIDAGKLTLRLEVTDKNLKIEVYPLQYAGVKDYRLHKFEINLSDNRLKLTP